MKRTILAVAVTAAICSATAATASTRSRQIVGQASASSWHSCPTGYKGIQGYSGGGGIVFGGLRERGGSHFAIAGHACDEARSTLQEIAVNYRATHRYLRTIGSGLAGSWHCTYSTPVEDFGSPLHYGRCTWSHGGEIRFRVG